MSYPFETATAEEWARYQAECQADEARGEAEYLAQKAQCEAMAEASYPWEFQTIPTLCEGLCPAFDAWQERQNAIGEGLWDTYVNR